jgi:hypothetical protein
MYLQTPRQFLVHCVGVHLDTRGTYAVQQGYMGSRTITLGDNNLNYGGGSGWNTNTAALMFECADNTEIAVHDSGTRIASLMYFEGSSTHRITIGRDMGWGAIGEVYTPSPFRTSSTITSTNGNNSYSYYGPNSTWASYLLTGSGDNKIGTRADLAQVLSTNGNLHLDAGVSRHIYFNYYAGTDMYFCNGGNAVHSVFKPNGNFGLGTTNPQRRLDVNGTADIANLLRVYGGSQIRGSEAVYNYAPNNNDYLTNGGNVQVDSPSLMFGLYVQYSIQGAGIVVFSDQRMKSNVVDINDTTALDQVRLLKPKYYEYVDKVNRGSSRVIGFIAQEVKEVLPRAVSVADGEIPNIYEIATISSNITVTFTNFNTSNLEGTNCTLIAYLAEDKRKEVTITEVVDEHTVRVEEDMSEWGSQLFVWGQKVDDFHHLNKDYIWTVATAALQEVDRQLQAEKTRNDALEARILALENR